MKCLFIKEPWISLILEGKKVWEIRSSNTNIRGRIGLIASGTGEIKGYIDLIDSIKLTPQQFDKNQKNHQIPNDRFNSNKMPYKNTHAWILKNPFKLEKGIKFKHKKGCVIWINLEESDLIKS